MVTCTRSRGLQKGWENTRDFLKNHVTCNTSFKMCDVACHMTRVLRVCSQVTSICLSRDCMSGSRGRGPPIRVGWRVVTWCVTWLNHVKHVTNGGLWLAASLLVGYIHNLYIKSRANHVISRHGHVTETLKYHWLAGVVTWEVTWRDTWRTLCHTAN